MFMYSSGLPVRLLSALSEGAVKGVHLQWKVFRMLLPPDLRK
jgi:hypothetical protein